MSKVMPEVKSSVRVRHGFERERLSFAFRGPSRTKQAFKAECDINNIMKRFERDGMLEHYNRYGGQYGDFTGVPEFQDAVNRVKAAEEMFLTLPASVRTRFDNDPGAFLAFVGDAKNVDEMRALGLLREAAKPPDGEKPKAS